MRYAKLMTLFALLLVGLASQAHLLQAAPAEMEQIKPNTIRELPVNTLVNELTPSSTCDFRTNTVSGSYKAGARQQITVYYQVSYLVNRNCSLSNIQDRTKTVGGTAYWSSSCTGGNFGCRLRNTNVGSSWTTWRSLPNISVDGQYRHFSIVDRHNYSGFRTLPR